MIGNSKIKIFQIDQFSDKLTRVNVRSTDFLTERFGVNSICPKIGRIYFKYKTNFCLSGELLQEQKNFFR